MKKTKVHYQSGPSRKQGRYSETGVDYMIATGKTEDGEAWELYAETKAVEDNSSYSWLRGNIEYQAERDGIPVESLKFWYAN